MSDSPESIRLHELWERHSPAITRYALRHVGPDQAEEVVAETFLVAWRRLAHIPGDALPWLIVVARNTIRAAHRSTYRRRILERDLARLSEAMAEGASVERQVMEREALLRGLERLTPREREALLLTAWDGLSIEQAATVAGCRPGALKVRLHRARRKLAGTSPPHRVPDAAASSPSTSPSPSPAPSVAAAPATPATEESS